MNILITGTTGFLGKVFLLDILDKHSQDLNKIFLLIRSKNNISSKKRFEKICNNIFLKDKIAPYLDMIYIIDGSLDYENFGVDKSILEKMDINIIVNNAASVKFNDKMIIAYNNNCKTVVNLANCAKLYFKNMKKIIHVSTFYVDFPKEIEYIFPENYNTIINDINNGMNLDEINKKHNFEFANSYVITKLLAEKILESYENNFKIHIVRPSIIANSYKFPIEGWNDSLAAYTGFNVSFGTGIVKYFKIDKENGFSLDKKLNIVPVDYVSQIMRETIFNDCKQKYINASINNNELLTFRKLKDTLTYYNVLNYKGEYILTNKNMFWLLNYIFDYLYYVILYYFCLIFDYKSSKKINFICKNISNINDIFFYYIHNEWDSDTKITNIDMDYYHNIIVPRGNNKFILKKDLNNYSLIKKNPYYFDINWLFNKYRYNFFTDITAFVLKKTFQNIFSDILIDIEKLIDVIHRNKGENLILCPNHRSYCDFLLMSYILYELKSLGVQLPLVAATSDFKKVPFIGSLFKNLGCFYVERGRGKCDYLNNQVKKFINNKENLEFFIEGTRSRTRQTLKYKTGLIKSLQETGKSFKILPITFSYEKIPEQEIFLQEILSGNKYPMRIKGLFLWAGKKFFKKESYGNVNVKFSEMIDLKPDSIADTICRKICREYQINSVITDYHFKFAINKNIEIHSSGLTSTSQSSILEEWICMNQWIFKYIQKSQANNFWEEEYFDFYDYLNEEDKIRDTHNDEYHKKYFKYINIDIENILNQLINCKVNEVQINKLVLGNVSFIFVKKILEKYKLIQDDLYVNLSELKIIDKNINFFPKNTNQLNTLSSTNSSKELYE